MFVLICQIHYLIIRQNCNNLNLPHEFFQNCSFHEAMMIFFLSDFSGSFILGRDTKYEIIPLYSEFNLQSISEMMYPATLVR